METNLPGSNKAGSYVRALDYLAPVLSASDKWSGCADIWGISEPAKIDRLYHFILSEQSLPDGGIFRNTAKPSYWRNRYYSSALKSLLQFVVENQFELKLERQSAALMEGKELAKKLQEQTIDNYDLLVDCEIEKSGAEQSALVKTRLNQRYFRKMVLANYGGRCCVTGLQVPETLRASHISPWAQDRDNRMNPSNGLCLSATYDAAFDRHLISFDDKYRLVLSPALREYAGEAHDCYFREKEGQRILSPIRFQPDSELLDRHCDITISNRMSG
jgi:putative restriction endonuclease